MKGCGWLLYSHPSPPPTHTPNDPPTAAAAATTTTTFGEFGLERADRREVSQWKMMMNDDDQTCAERSRGQLMDKSEFDLRENEAAIRVGGGQLRS
eukprot:scaffold9259_cov73-Skeletonema_dohrnii-CCMP3373.AAC.2